MVSWNGAVATREEVRAMKRRAAVRVAAKFFNEKGYHATSLDEIADEIGVTKTALYYYFRNKEQLLHECLQLTYSCGQEAKNEAEALEGSAFEKMRLLYKRFVEKLLEECGAYTTMSNILTLPEDMQTDLLAARAELDEYFRHLMDKAIAEGAVRKVDTHVTSTFFLGAVNWILRWHIEEGTLSPAEVSDHFLDLFLNGIAQRA